MKNASFRQKLLTSFLAIGILPLLICTLLMLNIFRLSLTRSAADAAETQLDAMSGELSGLLSDCETVMEKLCAEPAVAAALDRSELDEQRVYSVLYRAAAPVLGGASLSVYGADGRQLYSTSSQPASTHEFLPKEAALESLLDFCQEPTVMIDLYTNVAARRPAHA